MTSLSLGPALAIREARFFRGCFIPRCILPFLERLHNLTHLKTLVILSGRPDEGIRSRERMSTYFPSGENLESQRKWFLVDASGLTVGRLASRVAPLLMGKHKPNYTPFLDLGDHVVVINAEQVKFTGSKWKEKMYRWHSGYPGGLKETSAETLLAKHPERIVAWAIKGMLPKTKLGRKMGKKLKVYVGGEHPHQAQQPEPFSITTR